jgi:glycosyltransferase involved in cell wall biosynthesis
MVLLNALAAGLPIVTTRLRGAADYLHEPDTCRWVEPNDPQSVADRVEELLDAPDLRAAMSSSARDAARAFEPLHVAREYIDLYRRIAAPTSPPAHMLAGVGGPP